MKQIKPFSFALSFFALSLLYVFNAGFFWWYFTAILLFSFISSWYFINNSSAVLHISLLVPLEFFVLNFVASAFWKVFIVFSISYFFYILFRSNFRRSSLILISFVEFLALSSIVFSYIAFYDLSIYISFFLIFLLTSFLFFFSIAGVLNLNFVLKFRLFAFSLIAAIVVSEFFWLLTKLPFNFITSGFLSFLIYYIIWDISIRYFASTLTKKAVYYILLFLLLILAVIFITVR